MELSENEALCVLNNLPHFGPVRIRRLLDHHGGALAALERADEPVKGIPAFALASLQKWGEVDAWKRDLDLVHKFNVQLLGAASPHFPRGLLDLKDCPPLLYVLGKLPSAKETCLAMVGSRATSTYGEEMARKLARELAGASFPIISGCARGIDTAAHEGALQALEGKTHAFIGSGLANFYPPENRGLARRILEKGAVMSEFPMETPPDRRAFPQRNRLVAAMSQGIILIEGDLNSGSLITMELGKKLGRRLFALPGRVDMPSFQGNHSLLKSGQATFLENSNDIFDSFQNLFTCLPPISAPKKENEKISSEAESILNVLTREELHVDKIVEITGIPVRKVNTILMSLLIKGSIKELPGKCYKKSICV